MMLILRTMLFVPGNREKWLERARTVPADALILDLEDSVPPAEKENARKMVAAWINGLATGDRQVWVRVNALTTPYAEEDIRVVVTRDLSGILLPKSESASDVIRLGELLARAEKAAGLGEGTVGVLPLVETPKGIINAYEIASASPRVRGITFGAEDYALEMGVNRTKEGAEIQYPRMALGVACRAAGVLAIDCVYTDVRDIEGLVRETKMAAQLGFQGKLVIHPDQVEPVNRVFVPSDEELARAKRVVAAFEAAVAEGKASTAVDGKMVDSPVAARARNVLTLAERMAGKGEND